MKFASEEQKRQQQIKSLYDMTAQTEKMRAKNKIEAEQKARARREKLNALRRRKGLPEERTPSPEPEPEIPEFQLNEIPLPIEQPLEMAPLERSPTPNVPWHQLVAHARLLRTEIRSSLTLPFSRMSIVSTENGCKLYALGTPSCASNQTVLAAQIPLNDVVSNIVMEPMFSIDQFKVMTGTLSGSALCDTYPLFCLSLTI
ncbi:hypothetical protein DICVIV_09317 [Dictyocaulus viviparus]|uniref:Uncharacterized protein n=1 Tax=Dictyocaulus viviparus TaxID=29172 RepID=A0A0D8XJ78_DICVI|nr:hypothetical protein DICVIV_09317 [Dictyocaulus viviparus]